MTADIRRPRLAYGTNVAPQEDLAGLVAALGGLWADVRRRAAPDGVLGLGLWLPEPAARALSGDAGAMREVRAALAANGLELVTVNAFPQRAFHAPIVKEAVYRPDWTDPARFGYTASVARAIAGIVAPGSDVTISTLPIGYPKLAIDAWLRAAGLLFAAVLDLHRLREATGTTIRLAIEPEPCCAVETTAEAIVFFTSAVQPYLATVARTVGMTESAAAEIVARHLGVCLDLCHACVEHEEPIASLRRLRAAGVPVHKVQVSAAVEVPDPEDAAQRAALAAFTEPRWLHQVGARGTDGVRVVRDLPEALADATLAASKPWRVHFHVPVHAESVGGLPTTRPAVERFLDAMAVTTATDDDPPVLEIETYTWSVVPGAAAADLAANIAAEIAWVRGRLER
ncbi:MAG: metabolite traffic protein EboE [Planctomycetes bacterium]|nr:metabolite traffic protein EboE [Planctomycetota bacterium]